jgi:hypothetical protein
MELSIRPTRTRVAYVPAMTATVHLTIYDGIENEFPLILGRPVMYGQRKDADTGDGRCGIKDVRNSPPHTPTVDQSTTPC